MSEKKITPSIIQKTLNWSYEKALTGVGGFESAIILAENYKKNEKSDYEAVSSLIKWQNTKAGTSGFITGMGGLFVMPVTIPANLASVMFIQIRMIAAIAYIGGYDLKDDRVKTMIYVCLAGNGAKDILKDIGIVLGRKITTEVIKSISEKTILSINKKIGFTLVTKFGGKGFIHLGKIVPIVGGVIGGTVDVVSTNIMGKVARKTFIINK